MPDPFLQPVPVPVPVPVPFHPTFILPGILTKSKQLQIQEIFDVAIYHPRSLTLMLIGLFRLQGM